MKKLLLTGLLLTISACGGGGGGTSSLPAAQEFILQSAVNQPSCTLKNYSSDYPNSYLGTNIVPTSNQKFDLTYNRSIGLKDYYPRDGKNNCNTTEEYSRLMYRYTLDRLQKINADTIEIYQYGPVDNFNASNWTINENNFQIPKTELSWLIQEAHNRNLKVTLGWQLWPNDSLGNVINTQNPTEQEMLKFLSGWNDIITTMAKISQENKVDNLYIQWHAFHYPVVTQYYESATQKFISIIDNIRKVYNGKLFMSTPRFYDRRIIDKVDAIVLPLFPSNWSYIDDNNISLSLLKDRFIESIFGNYIDFSLIGNIDTNKIPVIWSVALQSRKDALSSIWVEDGFCISSVGGPIVPWGSANCMQVNYVTDFSVQALAMESVFQAISQQTYFKTVGINLSSNYWHTDTLVPGLEGFPNLSQSIRGKPAESIVKNWFARN